MRMTKVYVILLAVAALAIGVIAPAGSAAMTQSQNIVKTAAAAGEFHTLLALAEKAGLAKTLESKGPFTVFAPTDAAFAMVPKATLAALKKDTSKLKAVLLYHVLAGRITAAKLMKMHTVKTLNGQSLTVRVKGGMVMVGDATVEKANVAASNGVIHVINKVLIPK